MVRRDPPGASDTEPPDEPAASSTAPTRAYHNLTTMPLSAGEQRSTGVDLRVTSLDESDPSLRYHVGELLGAGGMGEVHLCRDTRIGRTVALKRVRTRAGATPGSDPHRRGRFLREARIQGQLEHPAIVPVYDLGRHPEGGEFFTMKRVRGQTLSEILSVLGRGGPAATASHSRHRLLSAFSSVCLAVHYAHSRGVIHRDLKPDNLMLGDFGEVYILDWGVAKVGNEPHAADPAPITTHPLDVRTVAGAIIGTLGYAAPEVLEGNPADQRADVYALGAILFEILTLEPLHPGADPAAIMASTLIGTDPRAAIRASAREVPPELETLCVRATALDPGLRIASALALQRDLERFLDGDRDLELRREHSRGHSVVAEQAAAEIQADASRLDARQRALYEAGRSLALDPDNEAAAAVLLGLLTSPPLAMPAEVEAELAVATSGRARTAAGMGVVSYGFILLFVPVLVAIGVLNWSAVLVGIGLFAAATIGSAITYRHPRPDGALMVACFLLSTAGLSMMTSLFGAYILVPPVMAVNAMAFAQHGRRFAWLGYAACTSVALLIPLVLGWTGVIAPAYRFVADRIEVLPRALALPAGPTQALLVVGLIATMIAACAYSARFQRTLADTERQLQLQLWQLRQLVARPEQR